MPLQRTFARFPFPQTSLILMMLMLAFALRLHQLDQHALRGDEAATVLYAALPLSHLWELARVTDPHPPLFYALLHGWQTLVGEQVWSMRFATAAFSTLSVAALYGLARLTVRHIRLSLLATLLLAISPLQIWLAQDLRAYPLFTLLGLLATAALWKSMTLDFQTANLQRKSIGNPKFKQRNFLLYIGLTVACFYTHYYTVFLIAFHGLFVLLNARRFWARRWAWLSSQIAILLLITPGLFLAANFIGEAAGGIETLPLSEILRRTTTALITGFTIASTWGDLVSLIFVPIWLLGTVTLLRRDVTVGSLWVGFCLIPILGVIALSIDRPFFKERFLIQAHPALCLLIAVGLLRIFDFRFSIFDWQRRAHPTAKSTPNVSKRYAARSTILVLLLATLGYANTVSLSNYFSDPAYRKAKPWNLYQAYVDRHARTGDVMLTNFPEAAVSYYSPNRLPFYVVPEVRDRPISYRVERVTQIAAAYERIWFIPLLHEGFDETGAVLSWLDRHADRVDQIFLPEYNLNLYRSPTSLEGLMVRQTARFAHGIALRGYQIFDEQGDSRLQPQGDGWRLVSQAGDAVTLSLYWQADRPTDVPYTVFVHLVAADGFNRTGQDNQPVWGSYPTTDWSAEARLTDKYTLTLPTGTPSGDHTVRVGWYRSDTGERVPVNRDGGGDFVTLNLVVQVE